MTNSEKIKKIIASYSAVADYTSINLNRIIKNNYVYESFKIGLANDLYLAWPSKIDETIIHDQLFETLKTAKSILDNFNIDKDALYI